MRSSPLLTNAYALIFFSREPFKEVGISSFLRQVGQLCEQRANIFLDRLLNGEPLLLLNETESDQLASNRSGRKKRSLSKNDHEIASLRKSHLLESARRDALEDRVRQLPLSRQFGDCERVDTARPPRSDHHCPTKLSASRLLRREPCSCVA
jgi:hypothetical protein